MMRYDYARAAISYRKFVRARYHKASGCVVTPHARFLRADLQRYGIEIHEGRCRRGAKNPGARLVAQAPPCCHGVEPTFAEHVGGERERAEHVRECTIAHVETASI